MLTPRHSMYRISALVSGLAASLVFLLAGCSDSFLEPAKPTILTLWHVYGSQTDSPMSALVDRFNATVGREKGIVVNVTSVSNSTDIHFALTAAAKKLPGASPLPDMFTTYPKTVLAIGPERLMDWNEHLTPEQRAAFVPSFLQEGEVDGRLLLLPFTKSSSALFVNATIFDRFAQETGASYEDLLTWEGMFAVARRYHTWSGGKAFFKYDDWLHYSMCNTAALGGEFFTDKSLNFQDAAFRKAWKQLALAALAGDVCLLNGYATTAMMTGEALCGVESTAAVLYFKDKMTLPDNTRIPLRLKVLPVPYFKDGSRLAIQRGTGLGVIKSTSEKERAAAVFAQWFTEVRNNVPFVAQTGYFPVTKQAYENFFKDATAQLKEEKYRELYAAISLIYKDYHFYIPPFFDSYGEVERRFSEAQTSVFKTYLARQAATPPTAQEADALVEAMWRDLEKMFRGNGGNL